MSPPWRFSWAIPQAGIKRDSQKRIAAVRAICGHALCSSSVNGRILWYAASNAPSPLKVDGAVGAGAPVVRYDG